MKEAVKKEILYDITEALKIMQVKEKKDLEELKKLSNHGIEDVALHKDLDLVSVSVLLYSLYKVSDCLTPENYKTIVRGFENMRDSLQQGNLGKYNKNLKSLFRIVRQCDAKVKEHLSDVLHAAQIKKGSLLVQKGLSMGQAAGLMGLSNWDLQQYVGKTPLLDSEHEAVKARNRLAKAMKIFGNNPVSKVNGNNNNNNSKMLFFDAGPVITLVMSRLGWVLTELKKKYGGKFYITPSVKYELVERPLTTKRFKFEALEVMKLIHEGVLEVYENVPAKRVIELKKLANSAFSVRRKTLDVLQEGEVESIASAVETNSAIVMDERTLRLFIEEPKAMEKLLEFRHKSDVKADKDKFNLFSSQLKKVPIIRSIELAAVAYKTGLLESYIPKLKHGKEILVDAVLWSTKYNGCAVSDHEIQELKQELTGKNSVSVEKKTSVNKKPTSKNQR